MEFKLGSFVGTAGSALAYYSADRLGKQHNVSNNEMLGVLYEKLHPGVEPTSDALSDLEYVIQNSLGREEALFSEQYDEIRAALVGLGYATDAESALASNSILSELNLEDFFESASYGALGAAGVAAISFVAGLFDRRERW